MGAGRGCEVIVTRAGVRAMMDLDSGEVMHPIGPAREAEQMYLLPSRLAERLQQARSDDVVLFDVGLGAASNAVAAFRVAEAAPAHARRLSMVSFDHSLQPLELALQHAGDFGLEGTAGAAAHSLLREHRYHSERIDWTFQLGDLLDALAQQPAATADIVYWDVYSTRSCPELWTLSTFRLLRRVCREGATVHTYSGALAGRAAMLLAGFAVGLGPSSGAKQRWSTIAAVGLEHLQQPLDRAWLERLAQARGSLPAELPADTVEQLRALPQFC